MKSINDQTLREAWGDDIVNRQIINYRDIVDAENELFDVLVGGDEFDNSAIIKNKFMPWHQGILDLLERNATIREYNEFVDYHATPEIKAAAKAATDKIIDEHNKKVKK